MAQFLAEGIFSNPELGVPFAKMILMHMVMVSIQGEGKSVHKAALVGRFSRLPLGQDLALCGQKSFYTHIESKVEALIIPAICNRSSGLALEFLKCLQSRLTAKVGQHGTPFVLADIPRAELQESLTFARASLSALDKTDEYSGQLATVLIDEDSRIVAYNEFLRILN
jgi:hypothetical protein